MLHLSARTLRATGSLRLSLTLSPASAPAAPLHTSVPSLVKPHRRNAVKKPRKISPLREAKYASGKSTFSLDPVVVVSPLAETAHPEARFEAEERALAEQVRRASEKDLPLPEIDHQDCSFDTTGARAGLSSDPYAKDAGMCILCPRRYSVPIRPHYKNPKLLAQFVSPHTGLTYKSHITGLCAHMQAEVEEEVKRAQSLGFLATKQKELHYLKDPPLFNAARPMKKNPH